MQEHRRVTGNEETNDPKLVELFEAGREAYGQWDDIHDIEITFGTHNGRDLIAYVDAKDRELFAEGALEEFADTKSYFPQGFNLEYPPEERIKAFIRGFGFEAANKGDLATAISVVDAILEEDDTTRSRLEGTLIEILGYTP